MAFRVRYLAGIGASLLICRLLTAEVPSRKPEELKKEADLIVTGVVTKVTIAATKRRDDGKEYIYHLTLKVGKVEKGKLKEGAKTVLAQGSYIELKKGFVGSRGHRSSTFDSIADVKKDWVVTLYLKGPRDDTYDLLFPNGFEVVKRPGKQ